MKNLVFILLLLSLLSCHSRERAEIERMKKEAEAQLAESQAKLEAIQAEEAQPKLVHLVMLNHKDELSEEEMAGLMAELAKLGELEGVLQYQIGRFTDLGDARALILDPHPHPVLDLARSGPDRRPLGGKTNDVGQLVGQAPPQGDRIALDT